ncbi:hypothetical protein [Sphingomonas phyllosphaerae]|uniref:hypothetical protein n=1 Tax=Sphingomonas phyllosphaerae TaxID=257003 RepID=UPI002F2B51EB
MILFSKGRTEPRLENLGLPLTKNDRLPHQGVGRTSPSDDGVVRVRHIAGRPNKETTMITKFLGATAALTLAAAPALAAPTNPATSLSVAKSGRAASSAGRSSEMLAGGGAIVAAVAAAAVIAGIIIIADDGDDSDSN